MPLEYEFLRTRLRIEQSRFEILGDKIGLAEDLLEGPSRTLKLNRNLILDVLFEIQ